MDRQKRKSTVCATATSDNIEQRKTVETKVQGERPSLKTVFTKVKENGDERWIYKIKELEENPFKIDVQVKTTINDDTVNGEETNSTTICTQIPEFTDTDIVSNVISQDLVSFRFASI